MSYDHATASAAIPAAQRRLEQTVATLTDTEARSESVLPGWTRGHVVTHIARNGDAAVRLLTGALHDRPAEQYPGGAAARAADIEAGSGRPAEELAADVVKTDEAVEAALAAMTAEAWGRTVTFGTDRRFPATRCAWSRWREVEIHHVDLGLDTYTVADWPAAFVGAHLPHELGKLGRRIGAAATGDNADASIAMNTDVSIAVNGVQYGSGSEVARVDGPDFAILAWLIGRPSLAAPHVDSELPELPFWS